VANFACFSRPELKVERWSYPCPTPSAARGVFEAVYFKPEFDWQVERVELFSPPAYIALRRNEVGQTGPRDRTANSWAKATVSPQPRGRAGVGLTVPPLHRCRPSPLLTGSVSRA